MTGTTIIVKTLPGVGVIANDYGYYSLDIPTGKHEILFQFVGYTTFVADVELTKDMRLNIELQISDNTLDEVVVYAEKKDQNISSNEGSVTRLNLNEIKDIPVLFGERDILKVAQLTPGIKSAGEGNSGFYVRGGGLDQNLILLDEAPVYNPSHLLGFFSVFNSDALRDVTGTVPSIPLITASILSKKLAEGIDALVLDVKWGSGAFMKTLEQAQALATSLTNVGNRLGLKTTAIVTDMNQPLGKMIGNAVEIDESVAVLKGDGPADVTELTLELGGRLLHSVGAASTPAEGIEKLRSKIRSGEGFERLAEMVKAQGGDLMAPRRIARTNEVKISDSGFICRVNAERLGLAVIEMRGGRKKLGDPLDHSTGIEFLVDIGDEVRAGDVVANVFCEGTESEYVTQLVGAAIGVSADRIPGPDLIVD